MNSLLDRSPPRL